MSVFLLTFRIDYDSTYQDRYESLRDQVRQIATSVVWDEPTSCYVFQASGTAESVCSELYMKSKVNTKDTLLVVDIPAQRFAHRGVKNVAVLNAAMNA